MQLVTKVVSWTLALAASSCSLAKGLQIQVWTMHPAEVLCFANAGNTKNCAAPSPSPHPRRQLSELRNSRATVTLPTVQTIGKQRKAHLASVHDLSPTPELLHAGYLGQANRSEPSLNDTTKWIQDTVATYAKGFFHDVITKIDGCTLTLQANGNAPPAGYLPYEQCKLDLSALDPARTTVLNASERFHFGPRISLQRSDNKPMSCVRDFNHDGTWEEKNRDAVVIEVTDADVATRLSKAFVHAEDLCGAKGSLF